MMHTSRRYIHQPAKRSEGIKPLILLVCIAMVITSCQAAPSTQTSPETSPSPSLTPSETAFPTPPASSTISPSSTPSASPTATLAATSTATIPPDPLEFVFPTQGTLPVSDWRPPLYPTPWAPTLFDHFLFTSPIAANETNDPVFDYRYGGEFFDNVVHTGIDIPAPRGTPILAAGAGTVIWATYGVFQGGYDITDPYGLAVTIQHDFGYQNQALYTIYGHMSEVDVVAGQHVQAGEQLGLVGESGKVTGPHLHFEIRLGKNDFFVTRNPELWLVPPIGYGIVAGRVMDTAGRLLYDQPIIITDPQQELNWFAWSYGKTAVNSDSYYQENLVIGNLPAGSYLLRGDFGGVGYKAPIQVYPGLVNYFTFNGYSGFSVGPPLAPGADFTPVPFQTPFP